MRFISSGKQICQRKPSSSGVREPGAISNVPPNSAGITDGLSLVRYEAMVTSVTIPFALARLKNHNGKWGLNDLRIAHRVVFGPVYDWAGKLRTINMRKKHVFTDKEKIEAKSKEVFSAFHNQHALNGDIAAGLSALSDSKFTDAFASLYNELNIIHPFREGNGRSLKTLLTAMARQAGRDFDWTKISERKWDFDSACIEAADGNISKLNAIFATVLQPYEAVAHPRRMKLKHTRMLPRFTAE